MMTRNGLFLAFLVATAPVVHAQSDGAAMTEEQILERFNMQKTRGLSIAPVSNGAEAAAAPEPAATTTIARQDEPPVGFQTLPPEEQVNINIAFDFDSAALREDQKPKLATLCNVMNKIDVNVFRILGHTDSAGSEEYNQRLSKLRAEEVKRFLVSDCGIAPTRLEAVGVGESAPILPEDPRADVNRRVEFQVLG
jgi:outer membrane protein OmpA-like peptidoglycan-associated protein